MADYVPLDLTALCNAGLEDLDLHRDIPTGRQSFHGLPFQIGNGGRACFILPEDGAVTIPIGSAAKRVIVAHRLLESVLMDDGPIGNLVADYVFTWDGGEQEKCEIWERFQIGD